MADNPAFTNDQLLKAVILWQTLDPLGIGPLESISLEVDERVYLAIYGVQSEAYFAEAVIPHDGSPQLWSARPSKERKWNMCGIVQRHAVRVITIHDTKNWPQVEDLMLEWLEDVHQALPEFEPSIMMYNIRLCERVTPAVFQSMAACERGRHVLTTKLAAQPYRGRHPCRLARRRAAKGRRSSSSSA